MRKPKKTPARTDVEVVSVALSRDVLRVVDQHAREIEEQAAAGGGAAPVPGRRDSGPPVRTQPLEVEGAGGFWLMNGARMQASLAVAAQLQHVARFLPESDRRLLRQIHARVWARAGEFAWQEDAQPREDITARWTRVRAGAV
jgi:hypothetical protein